MFWPKNLASAWTSAAPCGTEAKLAAPSGLLRSIRSLRPANQIQYCSLRPVWKTRCAQYEKIATLAAPSPNHPPPPTAKNLSPLTDGTHHRWYRVGLCRVVIYIAHYQTTKPHATLFIYHSS